MMKKQELLLILGIVLLILVVVGEFFILQLIQSKKTQLTSSSQQSTLRSAPQDQMCQSYINAIPSSEQKQYLADVSEGFVAYERGLISNIENTITWKGSLHRILFNETYKTKSCVPNDPQSCKDIELPHMNLIELKSTKNNATDVPIIFSDSANSHLLFFLYDEDGKNFEETDFKTVATTLKSYRGELTIKRTTLFNPTRRVIYISRSTLNNTP